MTGNSRAHVRKLAIGKAPPKGKPRVAKPVDFVCDGCKETITGRQDIVNNCPKKTQQKKSAKKENTLKKKNKSMGGDATPAPPTTESHVSGTNITGSRPPTSESYVSATHNTGSSRSTSPSTDSGTINTGSMTYAFDSEKLGNIDIDNTTAIDGSTPNDSWTTGNGSESVGEASPSKETAKLKGQRAADLDF